MSSFLKPENSSGFQEQAAALVCSRAAASYSRVTCLHWQALCEPKVQSGTQEENAPP